MVSSEPQQFYLLRIDASRSGGITEFYSPDISPTIPLAHSPVPRLTLEDRYRPSLLLQALLFMISSIFVIPLFLIDLHVTLCRILIGL